MANKVNNPMKVITGPDTRWSYANVWEAKSINGGTPKFSVSLIIPKSDTATIAKIRAAIEAAYKEGEAKLKGNGRSVPALSVLKTPLRVGTQSARMMKPMPTLTSSMPTARRLLASWMRTASRSWTAVRSTAVCTAGRVSTSMRSTATGIKESPAG